MDEFACDEKDTNIPLYTRWFLDNSLASGYYISIGICFLVNLLSVRYICCNRI